MPPARELIRTTPPRWWSFVVAGLCYSLFTLIAFPPAGVWALAVFAPVPLVWAGCRASQHPGRCALLTALGVVPLWVYEQAWLWDVTRLGYPLLVAYLSLYAAAFVWLFAWTRRCWIPTARGGPLLPAFIVAPVVWTALEVVRGEVVLTGYPWYLAGHPLIEAPVLAYPASLFGAYFVSFLMVALSGAVGDAAGWMGMSRGIGGIGAAATVVAWLVTGLAGRIPPAPAGAPTARIGVVQTNVPQSNKLAWKLEDQLRDWKQFAEMTRSAAAARPRPGLIVWPETMFPGEGLNREFRDDLDRVLAERNLNPRETPASAFILALQELQAEIGIPMLVGAEAIRGLRISPGENGTERIDYDERFNSTFLVQGGVIRDERYDKIELTPFGEIVPYLWRWPSAQKLIEKVAAGGMKFDLTPGAKEQVFSLELSQVEQPGERVLTFVTPICFEATKSELCRRLVYEDGQRAASLIVNVSNDGWFGPATGWRSMLAGGRAQHLQASRWRCVELGVPMIRAVNTGISAFVDRTGKIRQAGPDGRDSAVNVAGVLVATVPIANTKNGTVFGRIGNAFGYGMVGFAVLLPIVGLGIQHHRSNRPQAGA